MRMLMKVSMPVEAGNAAAKNNFKVIRDALDEIKPEAAYFYEENGHRTGLFIVELKEASQIPFFAEPWFLGLNASVEFHPAMTPDDLKKATPAIEKAVKRYS